MKFEDYALKTDKYGFKFAKKAIMLSKHECNCFTCGRPTKFIEVVAEVPLCSDECVNEFYKRYYEVIEIMEAD